MLPGNRCELCAGIIRKAKARHKQTKYCDACAGIRKRRSTLDPWTPDERREYMRIYMRMYRKLHPGLSPPYVRKTRGNKGAKGHEERSAKQQCGTPLVGKNALFSSVVVSLFVFVLLVPSGSLRARLSFEVVRSVIGELSVLVVDVAGLAVIALICWRHISDLWTRRGR
jgi:hypothetical protein